MIKINIDSSTLNKDEKGMITGRIYFSVNEYYFPEPDWIDSIVILLNWWSDKIIKLGLDSIEENLRFMEGPMYVKVQRDGENLNLIFFFNNQPIKQTNTKLQVFKEELLSASKTIITKCNQEKWTGDEISKLKDRILELS